MFGWIKASVGLAKVRLRGRDRIEAALNLAMAAYNLICLPKLPGAAAWSVPRQRERGHPHSKLKPPHLDRRQPSTR